MNGLTKSARALMSSENHLRYFVDLYNFGKQRVDEGIDRTLVAVMHLILKVDNNYPQL